MGGGCGCCGCIGGAADDVAGGGGGVVADVGEAERHFGNGERSGVEVGWFVKGGLVGLALGWFGLEVVVGELDLEEGLDRLNVWYDG